MRSTTALRRNVILTVIHGLLVTHNGKRASPIANNCQGQMKTHQYQYPSHMIVHPRDTRLPPQQTTVKIIWTLLSQYQYPSHMIVHPRDNRLPLQLTTVMINWPLLSQYQYPSHMIAHTRQNRLPPPPTTVKVKLKLLSQYQCLSHMVAAAT